jgi:SAM-dependent methyltransferase
VAQTIGYVTDVPYVADFTSELSPAWLDLVALIGGIEPPRRSERFAWCELGCGLGLTANIYAGTHPEGRFFGIDAMPDHIAEAERLAGTVRANNLTFRALDFEAALELKLPLFDYIVAHGVYSWIDATAASALRRFIARHLAPGGLVYLSYNAMPGWATDAPFQHLAYTLAKDTPGDSNARFAAAAKTIHGLTTAGAPALQASPVAADWEVYSQSHERAYFAHEYLAPSWRALYVDQMRAEMASAGLFPVGSATLAENFDALVLKPTARDALRAIADDTQRELARDYFLNQRFRRDVFAFDARRLDPAEQRERLLATPFTLLRPPSLVEYSMRTEAGRVSFDNPVARRLVASLADGARPLAACLEAGGEHRDIVANALHLCCARMLWPAHATPAPVERLNEGLLGLSKEKGALAYRAFPFGTALRFSRSFLVAMRDGQPVARDAEAWADYVRRFG